MKLPLGLAGAAAVLALSACGTADTPRTFVAGAVLDTSATSSPATVADTGVTTTTISVDTTGTTTAAPTSTSTTDVPVTPTIPPPAPGTTRPATTVAPTTAVATTVPGVTAPPTTLPPPAPPTTVHFASPPSLAVNVGYCTGTARAFTVRYDANFGTSVSPTLYMKADWTLKLIAGGTETPVTGSWSGQAPNGVGILSGDRATGTWQLTLTVTYSGDWTDTVHLQTNIVSPTC